MASMRNIKRRIKSVGSTQQITKAMNLVSAAKLQRAKVKLADTLPFFEETQRVIVSIVNNSKGINHPYLVTREIKNSVIILITGDRGLCGGYNTNVSKMARKLLRTKQNGALVVIGAKGKDYFIRRGKKIIKTFLSISEEPYYEDAIDIATLVTDMYKKGEVDEVELVYTEFKSVISHEPKTIKLLPVDTSMIASESTTQKARMNYEPEEETVLNYIIPKYLNTAIYGALVESAACQQGARMTSMDAASKNADKMISSLTLKYNRARQGAITQEITEIVSGASALE